MKWYKHQCKMHQDPAIVHLRLEFGNNGYAWFNLLLELVGDNTDPGEEFQVVATWQQLETYLLAKRKLLRRFLLATDQLKLTRHFATDKLVTIMIPKMAEIRDERHAKAARKSGKKSGLEVEVEVEVEKEVEREKEKEKKKEKVRVSSADFSPAEKPKSARPKPAAKPPGARRIPWLLPPWVDPEVWEMWLDHRKQAKKPTATNLQKTAWSEALRGFTRAEQKRLVEYSAVKGYDTFYRNQIKHPEAEKSNQFQGPSKGKLVL